MRFLKQYGGVLLILVAVAYLAVMFYTQTLAGEAYNYGVLAPSFVMILLGIVLMIVGGKSADKIGGE